MVTIIPAILATTEQEYKNKLLSIENSESLKTGWVQIDLMDNKFVQNQSIDTKVVSKFPTRLNVEAQLMVEYPDNWIDELVKSGVDRIVFPVEDTNGAEEKIQHVKNHGKQIGLSLNPQTSVEKVTPFLGTIDTVLVMSVNPGFGGQDFMPQILDKIRQLSLFRSESNLDFQIGVDGGINQDNVKTVVQAGADYLVMGKAILEGDIEQNVETIWENINS